MLGYDRILHLLQMLDLAGYAGGGEQAVGGQLSELRQIPQNQLNPITTALYRCSKLSLILRHIGLKMRVQF